MKSNYVYLMRIKELIKLIFLSLVIGHANIEVLNRKHLAYTKLKFNLELLYFLSGNLFFFDK